MPNQPSAKDTALPADSRRDPSADPTLDLDHEYQDSTESKLDHTRPPHHDGTVKNVPHKDSPQISIGES